MTELSPQAQVMIAVTHIYQEHGGEPPARAVAAAALRAAADQMSAYHSKTFLYSIADYLKLNAIATELENQ